MKNIFSAHAHKRAASGTLAAVLFVLSFGAAHAASITSQLDLGSTGQDVTSLQTYLATNSSYYPSGLITSYFGMLTQAGVQKFQSAQGIVSSGSPETTGYGRVGPTTMNRLNALMGSPATSGAAMNSVPVLSPLSIQTGRTALTFSWTTNEPTVGQVYWNTTGIQSDEATGPGQTPFVSGTLATDNLGLQTSHSVTVTNLTPNTLYYYFVRSIDAAGNMSVMLTNTIQTAP
jgi:peptidoglycan hydrolase-like protein with peptidoglycan-binding domain